MQKENFVTLILSTVGTLLFGIGMCMCLLPQWNTFDEGIIVGAIGLVVLIIMVLVRRKMTDAEPISISGKMVGFILLGIIGVLALGVGLCMSMVWEGLLVQGIIVGVVGIVILIALIPLYKGIE